MLRHNAVFWLGILLLLVLFGINIVQSFDFNTDMAQGNLPLNHPQKKSKKPLNLTYGDITYGECGTYNKSEIKICYSGDVYETEFNSLFKSDKLRPFTRQEKLEIIVVWKTSNYMNRSHLLEVAREMKELFVKEWQLPHTPDIFHVIFRLSNGSFECISFAGPKSTTYGLNHQTATEMCKRFINSNTKPEDLVPSTISVIIETIDTTTIPRHHDTDPSILIYCLGLLVFLVIIVIASVIIYFKLSTRQQSKRG